MTPEADGLVKLAREFHDAYERLAPTFGYTTRPDTREFDEGSPNGLLMIAVCREVLASRIASQKDALQPAPVQQALTERQVVQCLVESSCIGKVNMSYDSGPYEITRSSINADRLVRAVERMHGIVPPQAEALKEGS